MANQELTTALTLAGNAKRLAAEIHRPWRTIYYQVNRGHLGHREAYAVARRYGLNPDRLMERVSSAV